MQYITPNACGNCVHRSPVQCFQGEGHDRFPDYTDEELKPLEKFHNLPKFIELVCMENKQNKKTQPESQPRMGNIYNYYVKQPFYLEMVETGF